MEFKRLGDIASFINGFAFKPEHWGNTGLPIIRIQNLTNTNSELNYYAGHIDDKYIINKGDILIAWSASLGVHEWNGNKALLNQHIFKVVFDKVDVNKSYFRYMVSQALTMATKYLHGSTMKHLTKKYFDDILIPFPELEIQERIGVILDKTREIMNLRETQISALDELTQSVFLEMFNNLKDKIKIEDFTEVQTGSTPSRKNNFFWERGTIPWIKTGEVKMNYIEESEEFITEVALEKTSVSLLPVNTILVAMYGQGVTRGRVGLLKVKATTNQACAAILPNDNYKPEFLFKQLMLKYKELRDLGRGGNQPNLNLSLVKNFEVILPPLVEQEEFNKISQTIEQKKRQLQTSLQYFNNLYDSLLQKAFNGELIKVVSN